METFFIYMKVTMDHVVEIRTLTLKPGKRAEFERLFSEQSHPLLLRWGMDVVAYGPSLHDENTFYVIRCFEGLAQHAQMEEAFYGSDDWIHGPREAMLALVEGYVDAVLEMDEHTVEGLRKSHKDPKKY